MSTDPKNLIGEFRKEVKDKRRGALIDSYLKKPSPDALSQKALELLTDEINAIEKP